MIKASLNISFFRRIKIIALFSILLISNSSYSADDVKLTTFKAVSTLKFLNYIDIPGNAPLVACVAGDNNVLALLKKFNETRTSSKKPSEIKSISASEAKNCSIIFINKTNEDELTKILSETINKPIITISDSKGFTSKGGIIELYQEDGKLKFAINLKKSAALNLKIDSKLIESADKTM